MESSEKGSIERTDDHRAWARPDDALPTLRRARRGCSLQLLKLGCALALPKPVDRLTVLEALRFLDDQARMLTARKERAEKFRATPGRATTRDALTSPRWDGARRDRRRLLRCVR